MVEVTLKPCPFCGGEAFMEDEHWREGSLRGREPTCRQCGLTMPRHWPGRKEADAITAWNTRHQSGRTGAGEDGHDDDDESAGGTVAMLMEEK